jgi:hypothetical protein
MPDSWIPGYNLACLEAILGNPQKALDMLHRIVSNGFGGVDLLQEDKDLATVRQLTDFQALLKKAREASANQQG